jgi:hypothetical protein
VQIQYWVWIQLLITTSGNTFDTNGTDPLSPCDQFTQRDCLCPTKQFFSTLKNHTIERAVFYKKSVHDSNEEIGVNNIYEYPNQYDVIILIIYFLLFLLLYLSLVYETYLQNILH